MSEEDQLGPSLDGTVVLDIGGDVGALVLHTGAELHLAEIDLSRLDGTHPLPDPASHGHHHHDHDGAPRTHVAVRERRGPAGVRYAAIYPALRAGEYTIYRPDGASGGTLVIVGGQVTELDWR